MTTLGAGIAEHAAAATLPVMLEPSDSHALSSVMHTFGERVVAAPGRAKSEGGARSHLSGLASAVGSLLGLRFEASPAQAARAQEQQQANLMDQDPWAEPPAAPGSASIPHDDALHHRSASEVGANGQEHHNIYTPNSTLPYGDTSPQRTSLPGLQAAIGTHVSSGSLPPPSGGQSAHHSQASGMSELRKREIATQQASRLKQIAQQKLAAARQIAQLELAAAEAEAAECEAQVAEEYARAASSNAPS